MGPRRCGCNTAAAPLDPRRPPDPVVGEPADDGGIAVGRKRNGVALSGTSNRVCADQLSEREAVERVGNLISILVIKRDLPKGGRGRRRALIEVQDVLIGSIKRPACLIAKVDRIDRVLRHIRTETQLSHYGALEIIIAVDTHRVGVH